MLIGWVRKRGLSILVTFLFALMSIAVFPEIANAHGNADRIAICAENAAYVDAGHVNEPSYACTHCHSNFGQDCSTQIAFLITSSILSKTASFDVSVRFYTNLRTGWLLSFDPPPPRVLS
ncbi:MAG: hypothetical protein COB39_01455 [Marinosulfonomonas sp.]|nr:MAG: hypothetical protein COB39_01455 [Marinosulfonomonas sp.]